MQHFRSLKNYSLLLLNVLLVYQEKKLKCLSFTFSIFLLLIMFYVSCLKDETKN